MFELMVAARTDEKLRATLQVVLDEYATNIHDTAKALPGADKLSEETLAAVVAILTNAFIGTAIVRAVLPQPELEDGQLQLLSVLLSGLLAPAPSAGPPRAQAARTSPRGL